VAIDGFHVTPKNVFTLLKGDGMRLRNLKEAGIRKGRVRQEMWRGVTAVLARVSRACACKIIYVLLVLTYSHRNSHAPSPLPDTPGHLTSIKFRREKVFRAIEVVLTRVSAIDLAERRRHEAKLAIEKRLAEEAYEAVRVQQVSGVQGKSALDSAVRVVSISQESESWAWRRRLAMTLGSWWREQELYAAQLALAKKEIAVLVIEAEAR
jgi:hypothetical protein